MYRIDVGTGYLMRCGITACTKFRCGSAAICAITKFSNAALPQSNDNSIDSILVITHGTFSVKSPRARPRPRRVRGSISPKASCFLGPAKLPRDGAGGGSSLERECPLSS